METWKQKLETWRKISTDEAYRACILEFGTKTVLSDTCRQYVEAHIESFLLQLLIDPNCKRVFGWEEDCDETEHYYLENERIFFKKLMTRENAELVTETMLQILQDGKIGNFFYGALIEIFRQREEFHIDVPQKPDMDSMTFFHDGLLKFPEIALTACNTSDYRPVLAYAEQYGIRKPNAISYARWSANKKSDGKSGTIILWNWIEETKKQFPDFDTEHLVLPEGMTYILNNIGYEARSLLESVKIPDSVEVIYAGAFTPIDDTGDTLKTVYGGKGLKVIKSFAFEGCSSLTEISIPETTEIEPDAFKDCTAFLMKFKEQEELCPRNVFLSLSEEDKCRVSAVRIGEQCECIQEYLKQNCKSAARQLAEDKNKERLFYLLKQYGDSRTVSDMQEGVIEATEKSGDFELRAEVLDFCHSHFKPMTIQERFAL